MSGVTARYCLALDLVDEADKIAEYQRLHQRIWPEVATHLRQQGVVNMEIYQLGSRLFMVMEVNDRYNAQAFAQAAEQNPHIQRWETLMWQFQRPTPWTPAGEKWVAMARIFSLQDQ